MGGVAGWRGAALLVAVALLAGPPARAEERPLRFRPADAEARDAWAALLRADRGLRAEAARHRFPPGRGLLAARTDLDGDGRPELILYADLPPYCGSAGCVARILARRGGRWVLACETHVEGGNGFVVDTARSAGWRNLRGTWRMRWREDGARPAGVACLEGAEVPRAEQARAAGWPR